MIKIYTFLILAFAFSNVALSQTEVTIPASKDNTMYQTFSFDNGPLSNGSGDYFFTGIDGGEGGSRIKRSLLQFDLLDFVPADAQITSVVLTLDMNRTNAFSSGPMTVTLHPLQSDWGEGSSDAFGGEGGGTFASSGDATWLHTFFEPDLPSINLWTNEGGDFDANPSATTTVDTIAEYSWGSTEAMVNNVQTWLENPQSNFGWILIGDESGDLTAKRYTSRNNPNGNGPQLLLTYIIPPNIPPVAVNDTSETDEEQAVVISILSNDSDPDGFINSSSVEILSGPSNGSTTILRGIVTYTPEDDFFGTDIFRYTVEDTEGDVSNVAQVTITVHPVNDAPITSDDQAETNEDVAVGIDILANDTDDHGFDISSINIGSGPFNGSVTSIDPNTGAVNYLPANNFFGPDSFSYTVQDDSGSVSNTATVLITVNSINDNPIADNDVSEVDEDALVTIDILGNDNDIDGTINATSVNITTVAVNGTTQVNALTGQVRYIPDANYFGADSFMYTVEDNNGATSNQATVTITVNSINDPPIAANDEANTNEDVAVIINILDNDMDSDGNLIPSSVSITNSPANGSITNINSASGVVTYHPIAGFNGEDTFTYTVNDDSNAVSNEATVTVNVSSVNDQPIAVTDDAETNEDSDVIINILVNDSDSDGDIVPSTVAIISDPEMGVIISVNAENGAVTYSPNDNYFGEDSFVYTVEDDSGSASEETLVSITVHAVNDAPTAVNDEAETNEENQLIINVLANDNDIENNIDPATVSVVDGPTNGTINSINSETGAVSYTPDENFNGEDSFSYTVQDDSGAVSNEATVAITITPQNDSPVISEIPIQTFNEDDSLIISLQALSVFVTDPDNEDSTLIFMFSETNNISALLLAESVKFTTPPNWFGEDSVRVIVSDGELSDSTMVYFNVRSINDAPMFINLPQEIEFENSGSFQLELDNIADDNDLPNDSLRWVFSIDMDSVLLDYNTVNRILTLTAPNFAGFAVLSFTVTDDSAATVSDSILIHVTGTVTSINELSGPLPEKFSLLQNYPNPFNPATKIAFDMARQEAVKLSVYNIRGQMIGVLVNEILPRGRHLVEFQAQNLSSGIYFYMIEAGSFREIKRMLLIK